MTDERDKKFEELSKGIETAKNKGLEPGSLIDKVALALDGVAVVNCAEPSPGDLERVVKAYGFTRLELAALQSKYDKAVAALRSISRNNCCDQCQQAKLVALSAMKELGEE